MGGYGAVSLALRYPDVFSAAASHSGVLSPLLVGAAPFAPRRRATRRTSRTLRERGALWPTILLAFGRDTAGWWARDPGRLARARAARPTRAHARALCRRRRADRFVDQTARPPLHARALGVPHAYAEWPGAHDWDYWRAHVARASRGSARARSAARRGMRA